MVTTAEPDLIEQAIAALTEVAKQTRVRGAGTPHEQVEPIDFGEIACHVLTAVAANRGGAEELLAGRPGSWEADYVRQIVLSTAGDSDDALLPYRTEPIRLTLDVEGEFYEFGLGDLYEEAAEELGRAEDAAQDAVFEAFASDEERSRIVAIQTELNPLPLEQENLDQINALMNEASETIQRITTRAQESGDPLAAALAQARRDAEAVDALWEQDQRDYAAAYGEAVRQALKERGSTAPVELSTELPSDAPYQWDPFTDELHTNAKRSTPLPMTGAAPDWTDGAPADSVRRAGLTYTARVRSHPSPN